MAGKLKPHPPSGLAGAYGTSQLVPSLLSLAFLLAAVQPALTAGSSGNLAIEDVLFIVISQPNPYHVQRADILHRHINKQLDELNISQDKLTFIYLHKEWPGVGAWTIKPILSSIAAKYSHKKAVFFFEEETRLGVKELIEELAKYDFSKELFLGHGLRDKEATIIHHFAFHDKPGKFLFPDFAAGFILSQPLVKRLVKRIENEKSDLDFSIDTKHELAMFIWNKDKGLPLTDVPFLCTGPQREGCASYYPTKMPSCGKPLGEDEVFVAVKTYHDFHKDRVPIVQKTWGSEAKHIQFYSDLADDSIPTVSLGIKNTERGHCAKFMAILTRFHETPSLSIHDWLLVADDDTLISLPRLRRVLACYSPAEPVALGERYGYGASAGHGYDYITGGGGMVLNHLAVSQLIGSGRCTCGSDDSPDDMTLGMCLKQMGIPVTHSPLFHQARPDDYSEGYLSHQIPISFHKHWMIDPIEVYNKWLRPEISHDEL